ncbi:MAG TPA: aspartate-semialdehyde dehydrogenase [Firmicutes bacterium]|nr:aspartate-semialdehyde dehydrogenase [Bacillota bacterium]
MKKFNVAIVGATGLVGQTFLKVLKERQFPIENLYLMASSRSAGKQVEYNGVSYVVEELCETSFDKQIDIALFSAGGEISKKYAPIAAAHGTIVVDNSSAWRMDPTIPLVVPEVNPHAIKPDNKIIANPNCSTIQCVVPLNVLHQAYHIKRIVYSTYQAVSGSGISGLNDLENGVNGLEQTFYPHPIAYNCLPHIDQFLDNGYTKEEIKMIEETKKILGDASLKITATTVRVPVKYGHSVSINVEFEKAFELADVFELLKGATGIKVVDDVKNNQYPLAIHVEGQDEVYVGRIRRDFSTENGLNLWVVADNIRKGAATNTVQIAEHLIQHLTESEVFA